MYALCNKQPKRCSYDRPAGVKVKKPIESDATPVNLTQLLQYMNLNGGSCKWGAFSKQRFKNFDISDIDIGLKFIIIIVVIVSVPFEAHLKLRT